MKELRKNMRLVGFLVVFAFVGLSAWFALTVFEQGSIWASNSYNTRLGNSGAQRGMIADRDGTVLAQTVDGQRVYLEDAQARRALAVTVGDTAGMSGTGVEGYYSAQLLDISDSMLERLRALFNGTPRQGSNVSLTVDARLTDAAARAFPDGYRGAVCVTNYKTGEVLAMVSKPDYDPYSAGGEGVEDTAYLNRCLQGRYTPGSVFKIVTLISALEYDPNVVGQRFTCSGTWKYEGSSIVCAGKTAHGEVDLKTAFAKSCNVTFGKLAYQLGIDRLSAAARKLGFNENFKLGDFVLYNSEFPTEIDQMSELVWAGIGQGTVLMTPMHMNMITGAAANNGVMMKPWLVKEIRTAAGVVTQSGAPTAYRQVMAPETAGTVADYMYAAVENGTARRARIDGLRVCGKTGSAEISDDKSVQTHSWYTGFIDDPRHPYAVSVVVEQGGAGSRLAAELAGKVLRYAVKYVG